MATTYEFILWPNCRNNCTFCFQKEQLRCGKLKLLSIEEMEKSIETTMLYLSTYLPKGSNVMLVGGELFDTPQLHASLRTLLGMTTYLMAEQVIEELYVNTNLIYRQLSPVYHLLEMCEKCGVMDRLHLTTSYDFDGRFKNGTDTLMLRNLFDIPKSFHSCKLYVNTMLSKTCCEKILSKQFSVKWFSEWYKCYVNLIPYIELIPELTATRSEIIRTLQVVEEEMPGYVSDYITRMDINQDKRVLQYNSATNEFDDCSCETAPCGHSINFQRYSSNGSCYVCDMKRAFGL